MEGRGEGEGKRRVLGGVRGAGLGDGVATCSVGETVERGIWTLVVEGDESTTSILRWEALEMESLCGFPSLWERGDFSAPSTFGVLVESVVSFLTDSR